MTEKVTFEVAKANVAEVRSRLVREHLTIITREALDALADYFDQPPEPTIHVAEVVTVVVGGCSYEASVSVIDRNGPLPRITLDPTGEQQPPEHPDAVWKEIDSLRNQVCRETGKYHVIYGWGDGEWGILVSDEDGNFTRVSNPNHTPTQLLAKLREMVKPPVPTVADMAAIVETCCSARTRSDNPLLTRDEASVLNRHVDALREEENARESAEERATLLEVLADELQETIDTQAATITALQQEETDDTPSDEPELEARTYINLTTGCRYFVYQHNGLGAWYINYCGAGAPWRAHEVELGLRFGSRSEAQHALNEYAKDHGWELVPGAEPEEMRG